MNETFLNSVLSGKSLYTPVTFTLDLPSMVKTLLIGSAPKIIFSQSDLDSKRELISFKPERAHLLHRK